MEHPPSNDDRIGVFADDTPGLDRDEVGMHYNGAPELQLRESTTSHVVLFTASDRRSLSC